MNKFLILLSGLIFSLPHLSIAGSERSLPDLPPKLENFINSLETQKIELQGGAIAILYKGKVVYKTTFGKQNGNIGPITPGTLFPLASGSKAVAAAAIVLMADKGKIDLNEKFKLPYLKHSVSLTNILSHSTGYHFPGNSHIEQGVTRAKLLSILQKQQPKCKPGKCYQYSNTTFSLVEEVLNRKKLSLKIVIDNMKAALNTQGIQILPIASNTDIAYPHSKKTMDGKDVIMPLPFPPYYPKTIPASAGVFASIDGMIEIFKLSFGYRPDLISKETLDIMHTPLQYSDDHVKWGFKWPVDNKEIQSYYALGWRILRLKGHPKKDLIFHPGFINGINSFIGNIPSEDIGIIILANQRSAFPFKSGVRLWCEFLK